MGSQTTSKLLREVHSNGVTTPAKIGMALAAALTLSACGSAPIDESQFTRVSTQISEAEEMQADKHAGAEIFSAQKKLKDARAADKRGERKHAIALLKEAELHAELAEIRAMTQVQQSSLDEINEGLRVLRQELAK